MAAVCILIALTALRRAPAGPVSESGEVFEAAGYQCPERIAPEQTNAEGACWAEVRVS